MDTKRVDKILLREVIKTTQYLRSIGYNVKECKELLYDILAAETGPTKVMIEKHKEWKPSTAQIKNAVKVLKTVRNGK